MSLYYSTDGSNWNSVSMVKTDDSIYRATIPKHKEGIRVQYYIEALDNWLNKAKSDTQSYALKSPSPVDTLVELVALVIAGLIFLGIIGGIGFLAYRLIKRLTRGKRLAPPSTAQAPSTPQGVKYCTNCGTQIAVYSVFCTNCGTKQS